MPPIGTRSKVRIIRKEEIKHDQLDAIVEYGIFLGSGNTCIR